MKRMTLEQVQSEHGGVLPPDAVLVPDNQPLKQRPTKMQPRGDRFAVLNAFVDSALAALTGAEAKVWFILFRDVKAHTGTARTGQVDIARRAGLSVRAVKTAVKSLEAKGLLKVRQRGRLNAGPSVHVVVASSTLGNYASPIPEWDQHANAVGVVA